MNNILLLVILVMAINKLDEIHTAIRITELSNESFPFFFQNHIDTVAGAIDPYTVSANRSEQSSEQQPKAFAIYNFLEPQRCEDRSLFVVDLSGRSRAEISQRLHRHKVSVRRASFLAIWRTFFVFMLDWLPVFVFTLSKLY